MVKAIIHRGKRDLLPSRGAVAGLATLREAPMMRIFMAIGTLVEWDTFISRLIVRSRRMAFGAANLNVQTSQRITGLGVIELANADSFPVIEIVTLLTGLSEPSAVRILVARSAGSQESEVSPVQVFDFDGRALLQSNFRGCVAAVAVQSSMFTFKGIARLLVIERLDIPLDQRKIFAIVFGVATRTLLA